MRMTKLLSTHAPGVKTGFVLSVFATLLLLTIEVVQADHWREIEPLKSRRVDVERALGRPVENKVGATGTLTFKVEGGTVKVSFVTAKFIAAKKLSSELEGTVLQIVLQHERAMDSPESLNLLNDPDFEREEKNGVAHFRNVKKGLSYTFVENKLKTTWYSLSAEQQARIQQRKG